MQKKLYLTTAPHDAADDARIREKIAEAAGVKPQDVSGYHLLKKSIDARRRGVKILLTLKAFIHEPFKEREQVIFHFKDVRKASRKVHIIGTGPAGLFAALKLIECGIKPVLLERGKNVKDRRHDLALLNKYGEINPDSNYCFGEGGAGTYSDGKLYTRSSKRGNIDRILSLFVHFGAAENILYEAHPHIGTNKLPQIIAAIRKQILDCGGEIYFEKKVTDLLLHQSRICSIKTYDGTLFETESVILATGHSARDIFELLHAKKILINAKPFALGVRIEHPQSLIDCIQYHLPMAHSGVCTSRPQDLPPASYSWVQHAYGKAVFSFCMCPGGIIAPAATAPGELVVNGWSPSRRNNPFANSGIVVPVEETDWQAYAKYGPLAALAFQQDVEQKAFAAGGGKFRAPAQRMTDFLSGNISSSLPGCSYLPGIQSFDLSEILPSFITKSLKLAFRETAKKMKGYITADALLVATESRTSSPVRIPRNIETLQHPQLSNLYPCGEGAGYAGGIVSAAMDGENVAYQIAKQYSVI